MMLEANHTTDQCACGPRASVAQQSVSLTYHLMRQIENIRGGNRRSHAKRVALAFRDQGEAPWGKCDGTEAVG